MHIELTNILQCHLLTLNDEQAENFPFAPRSLGFVTPLAWESAFGDTAIVKMIPYSCTIGGTYDDCSKMAKSPLMGLNEAGVTYWEVSKSPEVVLVGTQQNGWEHLKSTHVKWRATYRLVWIINRNLLGYNCCSIADLIIEELLLSLHRNSRKVGADCLEGAETTCSGKFASVEITGFNFLGTEAFINIFGKYELSLFKMYTCAPFEFGALDITIEFTKCLSDLGRFAAQAPISSC